MTEYKSVTYSETLKPFRKDMQCGCCGARLYWHPKSNQWFCRECGMWSKPTQAEETFNSIVEKLRWLRQNLELIHPPAGKANVQSMGTTLLDREIRQALMDAEPDADALITKILHRAELEYKFCSARDSIQTGESTKPNLQEQLEQTQQEFDRLLEMSLDFDEDTPFLDDRLKKLNNKIKSLKKAIEDTAVQQEKASQPEMLLSAKDLQIQEYDDALTARIIEKITVRSRNEIEIRFIGGYKKTMQLT